MERLVQYLDDLEDLLYAVALGWERIRRLLGIAIFLCCSAVLQGLGIYLALVNRPLAVAAASILLVTLLCRGAIYHCVARPTTA